MTRRQSTGRRRRNLYVCESLERRLLLKMVFIDGTSGADTIVISAHSRLAQNFLDYTIDGGPTQSVSVLPLDSIFVDTVANPDGAADKVIIQKAPPGPPINITGHAVEINQALNFDLLMLGDANGVQDINSRINVTSPNWSITADDSGDAAAPRHVTISTGVVSGLAPADIHLQGPPDSYLVSIKTGSVGGSTFDVFESNLFTSIVGNTNIPDNTLNIHDVAAVSLLSPPGAAGPWDLNIDESNFTPALQPVLTNGRFDVRSINSGNGIIWTVGIDNLNIALPSAIPTRVQSTNIPTTITGNSATVGNLTEGVQGIVSNLSLGVGNIVFDDTRDNFARNFSIARASNGSDVVVQGLAPAPITYSNHPMPDGSPQQVEFDLSKKAGGGTLNVLGAGQSGGTTAIVCANPVTVNVGNPTTVPDVVGTLKIFGDTLALQVDDSADTVGRNVSITAGEDSGQFPIATIHGLLANGDILYGTPFTTSPVVIDGGSGGNSFTVTASHFEFGDDPTAVGLLLNTGSGNDSVDIKTNAVTVNGAAGDDSVTVDLTGVTVPNAGIFGPRDVTVDGGSGSNTLTIIASAGSGPLSVSSTAATSSVQTTTYSNIQTLVLPGVSSTASADLSGMNVTVAGAGSNLAFNSSQHLGTLHIGAGAQVTLLATKASASKTLFLTGLSIDPGGALDVGNNAVQLSYSTDDPVATIRSYLASGYDHGAWDGTGIVSSSADASHGLGLVDSADQVAASLPANVLLVRWTTYGDANLDGKVDFSDLLILAQTYGTSGHAFSSGDFNGDGSVGFDDLLLLAQNYGATTAPAAPVARRRIRATSELAHPAN